MSGAASDRMCVVLNDIHIDIMDYILPASCTDAEFRQMWAEFEWENKVCWRISYIVIACEIFMILGIKNITFQGIIPVLTAILST